MQSCVELNYHTAKVYHSVLSIVWLEVFVFLIPPHLDGMLDNPRGPPSIKHVNTHLYKWVGRVTDRESYQVSYLTTQHNTTQQL